MIMKTGAYVTGKERRKKNARERKERENGQHPRGNPSAIKKSYFFD